jgi:hypothetical protein
MPKFTVRTTFFFRYTFNANSRISTLARPDPILTSSLWYRCLTHRAKCIRDGNEISSHLTVSSPYIVTLIVFTIQIVIDSFLYYGLIRCQRCRLDLDSNSLLNTDNKYLYLLSSGTCQ